MVLKRLFGFISGALLAVWIPACAVAEPLKMALIESLSGAAAGSGRMYQDAATFSVEKLNASGGFNGEPIQLIAFDSAGNSSQASDKVKEAIEKGAHIIVQAGASSISGQISEDVRKYNIRNPQKPVIYLNMGGEALELTGPKCNFYTFRLAATASMRISALLDVMKKNNALGGRVYSINQNYSYGQDAEAAILAGASKFGYEVVGKTLHDFNRIQDFAPYVAKIKETNPNTIMTSDWSTDLLLLMKATRESGLKAVFGTTYLDYPGNIASLGDLAAGQYVANTFNLELESPQVVEAYKARTGRYPIYHADLHMVSMFDLFGNALSKLSAKNAAVDTKKIALAIEGASVKDGMGVTSIRREDHQAIIPIAVSIVKEGVKYPADGTRYGFAPVSVIAGEQAIYPVQSSCKIERPE